MYKISNKIIASVLVFIITMAELSLVGIYGKGVYALDSSLENQGISTNVSNVTFDAYFIDKNNPIHTSTKMISEENKLYTKIRVNGTGYLKDATISLKDTNNGLANFKVLNSVQDTNVQSINEASNVITLNQINVGKEVVIEFPIEFKYSEEILLSEFSKESKAIFKGTYVDGKGKENNVQKEIKLHLTWGEVWEKKTEEDRIALITPEIIGTSTFTKERSEGALLQTEIRTKIVDNKLPIKDTVIKVDEVKLNGQRPIDAKVYAISTNSTNGDKLGVNFTEANYNYNAEEEKVEITISNEADANGKVKWAKNAEDIFRVVFIYDNRVKSLLENSKESGTWIPAQAYATVNYTMQIIDGTKRTVSANGTWTTTGLDLSKVVTNTSYIESATESISKGIIYTNYNLSEDKREDTNYEEVVAMEVLNAEIADKIVATQNEDKLKTSDEQLSTILGSMNKIYNKKISVVSKDLMTKVFGEDGKVEVYNGNKLIGTLDKDTLEIDLSAEDAGIIRLESTKPVSEGKVLFKIQKAIKGSIVDIYNMSKFEQIGALELGLNNDYSAVVELKEPSSRVDLEINKTNLSTVVKNEDVELKAILRTDKITDKLFKNPVIKINLPKQIEQIDIKDAKVMFDDELRINNPTVENNNDGSKSIIVELDGTQTKYSLDSVTGGANLIIKADLTVNQLTSNIKERISMQCTNNNGTPETKTSEKEISFVAPTGLVTINKISNYAEGKDNLTLMNNENKSLILDIDAPSRNVSFGMTIINNYTNILTNTVILGRIPSKGNKDILTGDDLNSTFDMVLLQPIQVNGNATIYYSTNPNATKDLNDSANAWTQTITDLSQVKSYLIALNRDLEPARSIDFGYVAALPEKLEYNNQVTQNYIAYFDNNLESGRIADSQLSGTYTMTTGKGPKLEVEMSSNYDEHQILTLGQDVTYTIKVKNSGSLDAQGVKIEIPDNTSLTYVLEDGMSYIEVDDKVGEDEEDIDVERKTRFLCIPVGNLEIGKTVEKTLKAKISGIYTSDMNYIQEISMQATVKADNINKNVVSNTVLNKAKKPYFDINISSTEGQTELLEGQTFEYGVNVLISSEYNESTDTTVQIKIPEGMEYQSAKITSFNYNTYESQEVQGNISYNKNTRILTANVGNVTQSFSKEVVITVKAANLQDSENEKVLKTYATVTNAAGIEEVSEIKEYKITKARIEATQTSNIPQNIEIKSGDQLIYTITLRNTGSRNGLIKFTDQIPDKLIVEKIEYIINGKTTTKDSINSNSFEEFITVNKAETLTIKIFTKAKILEDDANIQNKPIVELHSTIEPQNIDVPAISHKIAKYQSSNAGSNNDNDTDNPGDSYDEENQGQGYRILGTIWKDENKNGIREQNEQLISGVEVALWDADSNSPFLRNNHLLKVSSNDQGIYSFENIPSGNYMVIFLYDTAKYSATIYRVDGMDTDTSSDAIDSKVLLDDSEILAGITNNIYVSNSNIYNIDFGIVDSPKFDFSLNTSISKVTVKDSTGTKVFEYNEASLQKLELVQKYINETTIVVEYKINVKNEGAIEGYVKKIADYLPTGMSFNSELNRDWYSDQNGTLYNSSLANTKILPGETKEVTLLLTKTMNESSLGTVSNSAEIFETYNEQGLSDYDSVPGNKASNEDDISRADLVISIKTGEYVMFIGLSLAIITIIGTSAYFIKKKVLR